MAWEPMPFWGWWVGVLVQKVMYHSEEAFPCAMILTVADIVRTYCWTDSKSKRSLTTISPLEVIGSRNLVDPSFWNWKIQHNYQYYVNSVVMVN